MANLGDLVSIVQDIVNGQLRAESSFDHANSASMITATDIINYLNRGVRHVAAGIRMPEGNAVTQPLQGLFTTGTVTTGLDSYVALPDDYGRGVSLVLNSDGDDIKVVKNVITLIKNHINDTSKVDSVSVKGLFIYYGSIPSTPEVLTLHYYRKPNNMVGDTDEPDGIPEHLQDDLLCNYAITESFRRMHNISPKLMSLYAGLFSQAISDLEYYSHEVGAYDVEPENGNHNDLTDRIQ